jgi:hypothetical protein
MSFIEDIQNYPLVPVTTGDGTTYELKMRFKGGSIDPMTVTYTYAGKVGSKPERNSSASPVYDLYFFIPQNDWKFFKNSIMIPDNEWLIKHPLYGDLKGYPVNSIVWDNALTGDVPFNIQFQESITEKFPISTRDYRTDVIAVNEEIQIQAIANVGILDFNINEINLLSNFVDNLEVLYENILTNEYINKIYDIRQVINDTTFDSFRFMQLANDILNIASRLTIDVLPASIRNAFVSSVEERKNIIESQNNIILELSEDSLNLIIFKENAGASNIVSLTDTVTTPTESENKLTGFDVTDETTTSDRRDYKFKKDVTKVINDVNNVYNDYINNIGGINFEKEDFSQYIPNDLLNENVTKSILLSIQEIKELSEKAKEETIFVTISDTTPELLAFELYGSATDENINNIINDNDLFGKETLSNSWKNMIIKKNTKIKYYA